MEGKKKKGKEFIIRGWERRNCPRNKAVNVGCATRATSFPEYQRGEEYSNRSRTKADIKTGHEAPWRRVTLISRKHRAQPVCLHGDPFYYLL